MSATTVARGVRDMPRQRHLRVVPAPAPGGEPLLGHVRPGEPARGRGVATGGLRLTRRGRVLVAMFAWCAVMVVVAIVVAVAVLVLGGTADAEGGPGQAVPATGHVVLPGETLWQIASAWAPGEDPREAIAQLVEFNALPGVQILAGQKLMLPQRG